MRFLVALLSLGVMASTWANPQIFKVPWGDSPFTMVVYDLSTGEYSPTVLYKDHLTGVSNIFNGNAPLTAVTGTFFAYENEKPVGDVVVDGQLVWKGYRGSAVAVDYAGKVSIFDTKVSTPVDWKPYRYAIRATVRIVRDGQVSIAPRSQGFRDASIWGNARRAAIGITPGGKLVLCATGGPAALSDVAKVMISVGCHQAVVLDGGGSAMLYHNGSYLVPTGRSLCNLFAVYRKSPYDASFAGRLNDVAKRQSDAFGAAAGKGW